MSCSASQPALLSLLDAVTFSFLFSSVSSCGDSCSGQLNLQVSQRNVSIIAINCSFCVPLKAISLRSNKVASVLLSRAFLHSIIN